MAYNPRNRVYQAQKSRTAARASFAVRRPNWIETEGSPICSIHDERAVWHKNKARESGGQWACKTCARLKSKGHRRHWKTGHIDPFKYNLKRSFTAAKFHSGKIGRTFTIDFQFLLDLWKSQDGKCAISGMPMEFLPGDGARRRNKFTMDRIDSSKGYERGNVWLLCDWVNRAKSDLTRKELLLFAKGIMDRL